MADGLNRWMGLGNLTENAELRFTQNGQAVLNFRIACNESYVDKDNNRKERVEYVTCVLWGKRAEGLAKFLDKGKPVLVEGRLATRSYEKDGQKRYVTEISVTDLWLTGGGRGAAQGDGGDHAPAPRDAAPRGAPPARSGGGYGRGGGSAPRPAPAAAPPADDYDGGGGYGGGDGDIPFASCSMDHDLRRTGML